MWYNKVSNEVKQSLIRAVFDQGQTIKEATTFLEINYTTARSVVANFKKNWTMMQLSKRGRDRTLLSDAIISEITGIVSMALNQNFQKMSRPGKIGVLIKKICTKFGFRKKIQNN